MLTCSVRRVVARYLVVTIIILLLVAVALCTQLSVASMEARGVEDGQIIMVSSMSGHRVPPNPSTRST